MTATATLLPTDQSPDVDQCNHVGGLSLDPSQKETADTQVSTAGVDLLGSDHPTPDTQCGAVGTDDLGSDHRRYDLHGSTVWADPSPASAPRRTSPIGASLWSEASAVLAVYSDALDDLEATRIANENRVRSLHQVKGLSDTLEAQRLQGIVDALKSMEHEAALNLCRALRKHPLGPWVKRTIGIGEKQGARLLAAIGDPYMHPGLLNEDGTVRRAPGPRTVSELWAYCGYHVLHPGHSSPTGGDPNQKAGDTHSRGVGVAPRRQRGQRINWNNTARSRTYLCAESCIKQRHSPYRAVYDDTRTKYADAVHADGTPLTAKHKHNRALRAVAKEILRDLWRESRELHGEAA